MKEVHRKGIGYHISETELHNHISFEGVIREVMYNCYDTMVKKRASRKIWDYGISWVSEVISLTHSLGNSVNGRILLRNMTGETVDVYKYLDLGSMEILVQGYLWSIS